MTDNIADIADLPAVEHAAASLPKVVSESAHPKILLVAYYCSPYRGSDWNIGWGRAFEAARRYDTTVITSERSRADVEHYLAINGNISRLTFVYVGHNGLSRLLDRIPCGFLYINPFSYHSWHKQVFRLARRLHREHCFSLVHQANLNGFREPGYLWKLDVPFIWGPIGGVQSYPWRFLPAAGLLDGIREAGRSIANRIQLRFSPRVRQAFRRSAFVLAANTEAVRAARYIHRVDAVRLLDVGLWDVRSVPRAHDQCRPLRILWSGELIPRKAIHILLRAAAALPKDCPFEIRVLGKGPVQSKAQALCAQLGIADRCEWLGWQPLSTAMQQYDWADVFAFSSLRDTSGTVILEALSRGVPVVCFDHQGAGDIVTAKCGIKVPVTSPSDAVAAWRDAIVTLAIDRALLEKLSAGAIERAKDYLWSRNGAIVSQLYASVLDAERQTASAIQGKG